MVRDGAGGEICGGPDISSGECSKGGAPRVCGKDGLQRFSGRGRIFSAAPPGLVPPSATEPTPYGPSTGSGQAVGCILSPLRGWSAMRDGIHRENQRVGQ